MKKIWDTIAALVLGFIITFISQSFMIYFTQPCAFVMFGSPLNINSALYLPIDFTNYTTKAIDNIRLSIPKDFDPKEIISSNPIHVEPLKTNITYGATQYVRISGIEGNRMTRLLIHLPNDSDVRAIEVLNAKELRIEIEPISNLTPPIDKAIRDAIFPATFYAIFFALTVWYTSKKRDRRYSPTK